MKTLFIFTIAFLCSISVIAQTSNTNPDEKLVMESIQKLFDGMRAADSAAVASIFTKDAVMQTASYDPQGNSRLRNGSLSGFMNAIGTPKEAVWDERIANVEIKVDANMANAWVPYSFYVSDKFSHCGVNSLQFVKMDGAWKIMHIVDTRRGDGCTVDL